MKSPQSFSSLQGLAALNHPRILKLFDVTGTRETSPWLWGEARLPAGPRPLEAVAAWADPARWCPLGRPGVRPPGGGVLGARSRASCFQTAEQLGRLAVASAACPPSSAGQAPPNRLPSGCVLFRNTDKTTLSLFLLMLCEFYSISNC